MKELLFIYFYRNIQTLVQAPLNKPLFYNYSCHVIKRKVKTLMPLCRIQHELEVTTKQAIFVDSSISDTIRTCIVLGNHRAAMRVRTEFKVSKF